LDCLKTRKKPAADIEIGHRTATVCHLGNMAVRLGRKIQWDPAKERIIGDEQAAAMLTRPYRAPYTPRMRRAGHRSDLFDGGVGVGRAGQLVGEDADFVGGFVTDSLVAELPSFNLQCLELLHDLLHRVFVGLSYFQLFIALEAFEQAGRSAFAAETPRFLTLARNS